MTLRIVLSAALCSAVSFAQTPAAPSQGPRFEVVAIKPATAPTLESRLAGAARLTFTIDKARVQISGYPLFLVLARAFRVDARQLDVPDFVRSEYFEMQATLPAGATPQQVPEMLQAMFADRFKLTYHRDTREYEMTALTVGKSGMKLSRIPEGTHVRSEQTRLPDGSTRVTRTGSVASLFPVMNSFGGLQMVDETGLDGNYTWVRNLPPPDPGTSFQDVTQDSFREMIAAAGLKMETRKVPMMTIIVDHLEKTPTEN